MASHRPLPPRVAACSEALLREASGRSGGFMGIRQTSLAFALIGILPPLLLRSARLGPVASYERDFAAGDKHDAEQYHSSSLPERPEPLIELRHRLPSR